MLIRLIASVLSYLAVLQQEIFSLSLIYIEREAITAVGPADREGVMIQNAVMFALKRLIVSQSFHLPFQDLCILRLVP